MINSALQAIHDSSMRILAKTGMRFLHPEAIKTLRENGVKVEGDIAYFTEDQIMTWIKKAPSSFEFCAGNPKYNAIVGGDNVVYGPGYGSSLICDSKGNKRNALMADYVKFCKLYEMNPAYKANGGLIVQPCDVPAQYGPEMMYYASLLYSEKCLQVAAGSGEQMETLMEMSKAVFGDLDKARILTIVDTNSPLQLDKKMTETMMVFGKYKQPVVITACVMSGTTGPITLAGNIALTNAEVLATIALSQMFYPGTPVTYSSQSVAADMATASMAGGSVEAAICYQYGALMGKFYGLPTRGGGAITDARVVNAQAGYESLLTLLSCVQNKMNYIIHGAGIIDGFSSMSYEKLIVDFEIDNIVKYYTNGFKITEETLAEDTIDEIGPGGNYMVADHTFAYCRKEPFIPQISTRGNIAHPDCEFEMNIEKKLESLLESYRQPELDDKVIRSLNDILKEKGIDAESYM